MRVVTWLGLAISLIGVASFTLVRSPWPLALTVLGLLLVLLSLGIAYRRQQEVVQQVAEAMREFTRGGPARPVRLEQGEKRHPLLVSWNALVEDVPPRIQDLEAEKNLFQAVLEHMHDGVLVIDAAGYVRWLNQAAADLLNVAREESLNAAAGGVIRHHRLIELWHACRRERKPMEDTVLLAGSGRTVRVRITPLQEKERLSYLMLLQDITYIRRLEATRRDFVSNISHELRTPLASLKAVVETLRDGAIHDPTAADRFLGHIEQEIDTLTQMVEELLELARIESGQVPLRLVPVAVQAIVDPVMSRFAPQAERKGLVLQVDIPPETPAVLADADRAQRILSNLVHNAIKFTPSGGTVRVLVTPAGEEVIIAVQDTGVGIPADQLPRIFERFYKVDRARSREGTGLGLAIAKHLVLAHGGRIWVESEEGRGSTFYFTLRSAPPPTGVPPS